MATIIVNEKEAQFCTETQSPDYREFTWCLKSKTTKKHTRHKHSDRFTQTVLLTEKKKAQIQEENSDLEYRNWGSAKKSGGREMGK